MHYFKRLNRFILKTVMLRDRELTVRRIIISLTVCKPKVCYRVQGSFSSSKHCLLSGCNLVVPGEGLGGVTEEPDSGHLLLMGQSFVVAGKKIPYNNR